VRSSGAAARSREAGAPPNRLRWTGWRYQRRGYRLVAVHPGAIGASRRVKPAIPDVGRHGIAIRDELELEKTLSGGRPRM